MDIPPLVCPRPLTTSNLVRFLTAADGFAHARSADETVRMTRACACASEQLFSQRRLAAPHDIKCAGSGGSNTTASELPNRRSREYMVPAVPLTPALSRRDAAPSVLWACV